MPDSTVVTVANGIAYELNAGSDAGSFNRTFESEVIWANRTLALADANKLRVDVALVDWSKALHSRGVWKWVVNCHVAVRKRFEEAEEDHSLGKITDQEIADLVTLLDSVCEYFMPKQPSLDGRKLSQVTAAAWDAPKGGETPVLIRWDDLEQLNQFTGYFPVAYLVTG